MPDTPQVIKDLENDLIATLTKDNSPVISIEDAARLCGMCIPTFRKMLYSGKCQIGIGCEGHERGYGVVLKLPLYHFMMNISGN